MSGELAPTSGVGRARPDGADWRYLSQDTVELPGHLRVLESLERGARGRCGRWLTASRSPRGSSCDRFGFRGDERAPLVRDLGGGERRRLQLMRLLMDEPNVLLLDEPTNDLDIDTLTALEDLLDGWPGTLVVVSHDRYFVERVTATTSTPRCGDGAIRHLPGGIDQYLERAPRGRGAADATAAAQSAAATAAARSPSRPPARVRGARAPQGGRSGWSVLWTSSTAREADLHEQMAAAATDHGRPARARRRARPHWPTERDELEAAWLEASEALEGA